VSEGVLGGLSSAVLAALCTRPRSPDRLELKIDNVFLLASRTVAATRQAVYSVVFAAAPEARPPRLPDAQHGGRRRAHEGGGQRPLPQPAGQAPQRLDVRAPESEGREG